VPAWFVELVGHSFDLERLAKAFREGDLTVVEREGQWRLRYVPFEEIEESASAAAEYDRLVARVNALALVEWGEDYEPVRTGALNEVQSDGEIRRIVHGTAHGRGRTMATVVIQGADGEPLPPPPSPLPGRLSLAAMDPNVDEALHYLQRGDPTWGELYKVFEIVEDAAGAINDRGWSSRAQRTRFTQSTNHSRVTGREGRHARSKTEPPANPMTLPEARAFIRGVVRSWLVDRATRGNDEPS
jgi:hypothetical protein